MHRSRAVGLLGILIAAASLPLTYVTLREAGSLNGIDGDAWPAVAVLIIPFLVWAIGDRHDSPPVWAAWVALIPTLEALGFSVLKMADAWRAVSLADGSVGAGPWVLILGVITALAGAGLGFSRRI